MTLPTADATQLTPDATQPAPARRRNGLTWVLGVLAVLLLTGTAVGVVLFLNTKQQTDQRLADQRSHIAELKQKLEDQDGEIRARQSAIDRAAAEYFAARTKLHEKNPCTAAAQDLWDAGKRGDLAGVAALTVPMVNACGGHF